MTSSIMDTFLYSTRTGRPSMKKRSLDLEAELSKAPGWPTAFAKAAWRSSGVGGASRM